MQDLMADNKNKNLLILVAPNISERMGGEALKGLSIYKGLIALGVNVIQITHERVRDELKITHPDLEIYYIPDDLLQIFFYRVRFLRFLQELFFNLKVKKLIKKFNKDVRMIAVHFTSPISPFAMTMVIPNAFNLVGPINGNIHCPTPFRKYGYGENWLKEKSYLILSFFFGILFPFKRKADVFLVSGGERTEIALIKMGIPKTKIEYVIDSGVSLSFVKTQRIEHHGKNMKFVFIGRFAKFKGMELILESLLRTSNQIQVDFIGGGDEKKHLLSLREKLGLQERVNFFPFVVHREIPRLLGRYRAMLLPSLREALGIIVQECMMLGLPSICLDWGGPGEILKNGGGILIKPLSKEYVVQELAESMDFLATHDSFAEKLSIEGREIAVQNFIWPEILKKWVNLLETKTQQSF